MLYLVAFDTVYPQSSYYISASRRHTSPWIFRTYRNIPEIKHISPIYWTVVKNEKNTKDINMNT